MPRKPVEHCGAFYHVITRGNQRQNLFHDPNQDREFYLDRLEQYRKRYGFTIYAYVLMSNHVHLLVETAKAPLSKIMQGLQFSYTRYFNRRYRKMGHLFQGRYRAILCVSGFRGRESPATQDWTISKYECLAPNPQRPG